MVTGLDWLVHGSGILEYDANGNLIGILDDTYDFDLGPHRSRMGNIATYLGAVFAESFAPLNMYGQPSVASGGRVPFTIEYVGVPNVE